MKSKTNPCFERFPSPVGEVVTFLHPVEIPGLEIMLAERCQRLWRAYHESYDICVVLKGKGACEWSYRAKTYSTFTRELMLSEPGESHRTLHVSAPADFDVLRIPSAIVHEFAAEAGIEFPVHWKTATSASPRLFDRFHRFHQALKHEALPLELNCLFTDCLAELLGECAEKSPLHGSTTNFSGLRRAKEHLQNNCFSLVRLEELAAMARLSRFHFVRAFAKEYGLPPHAYQIAVRIEKVRQLLSAGLPLAVIDAGFIDQSHLIRHFKGIVGVTPARYQASLRPSAGS